MKRLLATALVMCAFTAAGVHEADARQRGGLPAFTVVQPDGDRVSSSRLGVDGEWVLLYVQPGCRQCDVLLQAADEAHESLAGRLVVVVGPAAAAHVSGLAARFTRVPASAWFLDADLAALTSLQPSGTPFILGMRGRAIEWTLSGVLADARTIESVLRSWVRGSARSTESETWIR